MLNGRSVGVCMCVVARENASQVYYSGIEVGHPAKYEYFLDHSSAAILNIIQSRRADRSDCSVRSGLVSSDLISALVWSYRFLARRMWTDIHYAKYKAIPLQPKDRARNCIIHNYRTIIIYKHYDDKCVYILTILCGLFLKRRK